MQCIVQCTVEGRVQCRVEGTVEGGLLLCHNKYSDSGGNKDWEGSCHRGAPGAGGGQLEYTQHLQYWNYEKPKTFSRYKKVPCKSTAKLSKCMY